ncbi:Gfo/Idh/MocA family oxidoreductase [Kiloniella laminariae]|uniref:Gfo/Idh/MocA family oxidoreductase n=1 Tax=Kiloniella laminariae TaxID=454162 RepID=A0ABT4LMI7_9PROT|nr:Gfo/Idh/MocA family oxidoreductase [Kiloniella laminariae]MCZ4282105.1 Gfo/Idh/MocA family oxidoreductase [Kiloniella laminariae]
MSEKQKVLIVGLGNMGISHAQAYHVLSGFEIVGLCSRSLDQQTVLPEALSIYPRFNDYDLALQQLKPDVVSINTWPDTHETFAIKALEADAHVFMEKPIAETVEGAERVIAAAKRKSRKVVVGYILRHHPSWQEFVRQARTLGKPLVMRMNLNQQSRGDTWQVHKQLMKSISPLVDCGVHYVDMMCLMTESRPVKVHAIGARLSDEIAPDMYNYGQLQVAYEDGSIGWYEAGWGPMMSETAYFVKDVIGPKGSVSIVAAEQNPDMESDSIDSHTKTSAILCHSADLDKKSGLFHKDRLIQMQDEPDHDALCLREQDFLLKAITEDLNLDNHLQDAVNSMKIVLAADRSIRSGQVVYL